jgi:pyruvate/2-oxoglutarate dehydrogenase complex dihydrolipoamide dehydrogenase (E3) component
MKTAIDWLVEELTKNGHNFKLYKKEIEQAKEMEKQQIIDAAMVTHPMSRVGLTEEQAEQYFNETYKTK